VLSLHCPSACNVFRGDFVLHLMFRMGSSSKGYLLVRERFLGFDQYRLEILSSGLQCFPSIRARASDPRIIFFGPAAPLHYSSVGASPSSYLLWASSASALFECGR
jgi:hypothetical protein